MKVSLLLSARKRKSLEEENSLQDILQVLLQMQQDKKEANERWLQEREKAQRIFKEDWRQNESAMNRMIMAIMMTVAPNAVSQVAPLVEETVNRGDTHDTTSRVDKEGDDSAT